MGKHLPAIDGLRAFAVLAVVAYHAGLPLSAGYVGVDVFFVISGYVITRMLLSEPQIDLLAFYARRVRRILPALLVVVAAVLALSTLLSADLQIATNRSAMAAMAMGANVWFQFHTGYFDPSADQMPLLHLWSLGVEEQFYFVWPLLLIALRRRPWVLAVLAVVSLVYAQVWVGLDRNIAFYAMPARFWELAVGGLLAMLPKSRLGTVCAPVGLLCLCVAVLTEPASFPGIGAAMPVAGSVLVLHAIHSGVRIPPLEWAPVRYVGLVSYSFYLWHWPLLAIAKGYSFDPPTLQANLALCALAFVLASLSYRFIEQPFRKGEPRAKVIAIGVAACVALAGCSAGMESVVKRLGSLSVRTALDGPQDAACTGLDTVCAGDVVLWGDSHAKAWVPFAESFGAVRLVSMNSCAPSAIPGRGKCAAFNAGALEVAKRGRVVILGGFWLTRLDASMPDNTRAGFVAALGALDGQRVIVIGPLPTMPMHPQKCMDDPTRCDVPRSEFERRAAPVRAFMLAEIAKHPRAEYVEPTGFFCTPTVCPMVRDGFSLYYDEDHITGTAAREFATQRTRTLVSRRSQDSQGWAAFPSGL